MATTVWEATDNYAFGTLKFSINPSSTQITFNTGEGNNFNATLENRVVFFGQAYDNPSDDANREIVRITQNSGDVFDVTDGAPAGRGLEGTVAGTWAINDKVALVLTNAKISEIQDAINDLEDGTNPVGDANTVGGKTPTVTPTADSVPVSQAAASELALGWMNLQYATFTEEQTTGTDAGGATAATRNLRLLNTTQHNGITGASLGSNQVTLPAGTYWVNGWSGVAQGVLGNRCALYNVTDAADEVLGTCSWAVSSAGALAYSNSTLQGVFTIAGTKSFKFEHYTQATIGTFGLGSNINESGVNEVYSQITFIKIA